MDNLHILMNGVFGRKVPAEFAAADYDYEAALRDELAKLMTKDGKHFNRHVFNRNKEDIFELLEQNLEEVLPQSVQSALDMFVETLNFAQGTRPEFRVTRGKQRASSLLPALPSPVTMRLSVQIVIASIYIFRPLVALDMQTSSVISMVQRA